MEKITSSAALKDAIRQLEYDRVIKRQLLNEQIAILMERLKPVNLIKSYLEEIISTPYLVSNLLKTEMNLLTGHLSGKLLSIIPYRFRKILTPLIKFGVTILSTRSSDLLKLFRNKITTRRISNTSSDQLNIIL